MVVYCGGCGCGMVGGNNFNLLKTARNLALDIMVPVGGGCGGCGGCRVLCLCGNDLRCCCWHCCCSCREWW